MIRQRGVILISALVLVALAAIVAVSLFFDTALAARRTVASFSMEQALQLGQGAESLAAYAFNDDKAETDNPSEDWAKPYGPVEVEPGVGLQAQMVDEQGKFNVNSLLRPEINPASAGFGNLIPDENAIKVFKRLLELSGIETRWADVIMDWIDPDTNPSASGAEDSLYGSRTPSHLTGNQFVSSLSELLQIPDFTPELYAKLKPHVTALPPLIRQINVCTADGIVLDALYALDDEKTGYVEHSQRTKDSWDEVRASECFPRKSEIDDGTKNKSRAYTTERSTFFGLQTTVSIGTSQFALYSLMYRNGKNARAVLRTLGTD